VPGRERVGELQRARMIAAMIELVRECGPGGVTVAHVVSRSGVSRRTFYELFDDLEGCLLAAFDHAFASAAAAVLPAYQDTAHHDRNDGARAAAAWEVRVRAGLGALLGFLDEEPATGGLCVVDALAAGPAVLERRASVVARLVDVVHEGASAPGAVGAAALAGKQTRLVAEGAVGAVLAVVHARLLDPSPKPLFGLLNPLMAIVVLPYLGPDAAEREQRRPVVRRRRVARRVGDPLRELDMRLTYRTVRVLLAIAELGGRGSNPSGREVADAAGVSDQGQISKLLWRLEHLGLIENIAPSSGRGEPNAWTLTGKGQEVAHTIRAQAAR
jgi:AcrR family transcriptional regulator